MGTILDKIIEVKKQEVLALQQEKSAEPVHYSYKKRSFLKKLAGAGQLAIISEFKRASPSKGDINPDLNPQIQAKSYEQYGADAISVLTDETFFKGSFADLRAVREVTDLPILCKDFIISDLQVDKAREAGANLILLIAAALEEDELIGLYNYAISQGLEVLIEVHNEDELEKALLTGTKLIGVNNRNLKTFEVDLAVTEKLAPLIKEAGAFLISESGMKTIEDVERAVAAGANGILVGETFMTVSDLAKAFKDMKLPLPEAAKR